jgi:hypothetical protein
MILPSGSQASPAHEDGATEVAGCHCHHRSLAYFLQRLRRFPLLHLQRVLAQGPKLPEHDDQEGCRHRCCAAAVEAADVAHAPLHREVGQLPGKAVAVCQREACMGGIAAGSAGETWTCSAVNGEVGQLACRAASTADNWTVAGVRLHTVDNELVQLCSDIGQQTTAHSSPPGWLQQGTGAHPARGR